MFRERDYSGHSKKLLRMARILFEGVLGNRGDNHPVRTRVCRSEGRLVPDNFYDEMIKMNL